MVSYALLLVLYSKIQYNTILYLPTLHLGVTRLFFDHGSWNEMADVLPYQMHGYT